MVKMLIKKKCRHSILRVVVQPEDHSTTRDISEIDQIAFECSSCF